MAAEEELIGADWGGMNEGVGASRSGCKPAANAARRELEGLPPALCFLAAREKGSAFRSSDHSCFSLTAARLLEAEVVGLLPLGMLNAVEVVAVVEVELVGVAALDMWAVHMSVRMEATSMPSSQLGEVRCAEEAETAAGAAAADAAAISLPSSMVTSSAASPPTTAA